MIRFLSMLFVVACAGAASGCAATRVKPEHQLTGYRGGSHTFNSDIRIQQPGGTDFTVKDVSFRDESFEPTIYYGVRFTRWNSKCSNSGWAIDFTHPKAIANIDEEKEFTGEKNGVPVPSPAPISSQIQRWRVSFGHNMITAMYMHRWFLKDKRDDTLAGRTRPYAGIGAGTTFPRPLVQIDGVRTINYQFAGPAFQGLAGLEIDAFGPFSLFVEGKLHFASLDISLDGGGSSTTDLWTTSVAFGASFHF